MNQRRGNLTGNIISMLLILASLTNVMAQDLKDDQGVKWKIRLSRCYVGMGFIYQNEYLFQVGPKFELIKKSENFSIIPSLQIQQHHVLYLSPAVVIRYYKPIKKWVGPTISLEYSYRTIRNLNCSTLTPELGININGGLSIGYGYLIPLTNKPDWTWNHRIVLRLMGL